MSKKEKIAVAVLPIHGLMNLYAISSFGSVDREAQTTKNKIYNKIIWYWYCCRSSYNGLKLIAKNVQENPSRPVEERRVLT